MTWRGQRDGGRARRARARLVVGALVVCLAACSSEGDRFPARSIELVIAFPPGGVTDLAGRVFAEQMSAALKVPVVAVNKGGASGALGAAAVLEAPKDGYTLLINSISGMVLGPAVMRDVGFDVDRDFIPVALILSVPASLVVPASSPFKNVEEVVEAARARPGTLSYASPGTGSEGHFNGEVLARATGIRITQVPFKGGGEVATAVMGGHVDFGLSAASSFMPFIQGGKLRALAVTGPTRLALLPDVPTFEERGVKGSFLDVWVGCFAAQGTPKEAVEVISAAAADVVKSPSFTERVARLGAIAHFLGRDEFLALIHADQKTAADIATTVGMRHAP